LATVTGPNRQRPGTTGAKYRGEQTRPGTSRIGIGFSMPGGFQVWMEEKREPEIRAAFSAVKLAQNACESASSGFDAADCGDYVMRS
jgi:hypothetical protein